jgi:hypothetical protein
MFIHAYKTSTTNKGKPNNKLLLLLFFQGGHEEVKLVPVKSERERGA